MKTKKVTTDKIGVITLGCSKNIVDSENIITQLNTKYEHVQHNDQTGANIIIVNTCGFIDLAKEESVDTILHYADEKKAGNIEKLYVTGCLSQRYKDDLIREIPEVDAFFGTMDMPALLSKFKIDYQHELIGERQYSTPPHYAYLKISEGCNRTCSFCAIPLMRGKHRSRSIDSLVEEASNLAKLGVRELMLIAQESTYYGLDIYKRRALPELLNALADVDGIEWIRLHYAYPNKFPMEIIETMASRPEICNYLDIPLQHASNRMLKRMHRQTTAEYQEELINRIREINPEIGIRTTFLLGFPGESDEDFNYLMEFAERMRFERVGVFQYSHEEGTGAYQYEDDIPQEIKIERSNQFMDLQSRISYSSNQKLLGKIRKVLIDRKEGEYFVGRTEFDSPEVDNEVLLNAGEQFVRIGDFIEVKITDAEIYDLHAKVVKYD